MINYGKHFIDQNDINSVSKTLQSDWLTQGPKIKIFENYLKKFLGARYSLVVNNGTSALHLAFCSIDLKKNDIVLVSPITFLSSINAALYLNANPIFVDINEKNYCIDLDSLEKKLNFLKKRKKKVKAVVITDYAGQMCDWKRVKILSKKFNFYTINDNCHSLGSKYYGNAKYAVKYADIATHSFHPVKIITTGEGGSLSTNNKNIFNKALLKRSHGVVKNNFYKKKFGSWFYSMQTLGYNYRMPDINAALGISQIKKINKFLRKRRLIAKKYFRLLKNNKNIILPYIEKYCEHSYHLFPIQINFENLKISKKYFFNYMYKKKINLQVHYIPIHLQYFFKKKFKFLKDSLPNAEKYYKNTVSLPIYNTLKTRDINYICKLINKVCH